MVFKALIFFFLVNSIFADIFKNFDSVSIESLKIECFYEETSAAFNELTDNFYACNIKTAIEYSFVNIIDVNQPPVGKTLNDVDLIIIDEIEVAILPQGLKNIFPSIRGLKIKNSGLRRLTLNDLKPFENLKFLSVSENLVQFLPADLFSSNIELEFIDIRNNMIVFVDETAFNGLTKLKILRVNGLQCYVGDDAERAEDVQKLLNNLKSSNCHQTQYLIALYDNYIESFVAERKSVNQKVEEIQTCKNDKHLLQNRIDELEEILSPSGTCKFKEDLIYGYSCEAYKIFINSSENQKVLWTGIHVGIKSNSDVKTLLIKSQSTQLLPLEVGKTFEKLQKLIIDSSKLKILRKNDFLTLENISKLSINGNEILSIESETFDILTKLKTLDLSGNKIATFPPKAFEKLEALITLNLSDNLVTELKADLLSTLNNIQEFYGGNNKLVKIDIYFIWRVKNCEKIDLIGNQNCNLKFDISEGKKFFEFFSDVLVQCKS